MTSLVRSLSWQSEQSTGTYDLTTDRGSDCYGSFSGQWQQGSTTSYKNSFKGKYNPRGRCMII